MTTLLRSGTVVNRSSAWIRSLLVSLWFLLLVVVPAQAQLLEVGTRFGARTGTLDMATGLVWLDIPITLNWSYVELSGQLDDPHSPFHGWRYATLAEVTRLIEDAGVVDIYRAPGDAFLTEANVPGVEQLGRLLGWCHEYRFIRGEWIAWNVTWGMTGDDETDYNAAGFDENVYASGLKLGYVELHSSASRDVAFRDVGSFLVRDRIEERP